MLDSLHGHFLLLITARIAIVNPAAGRPISRGRKVRAGRGECNRLGCLSCLLFFSKLLATSRCEMLCSSLSCAALSVAALAFSPLVSAHQAYINAPSRLTQQSAAGKYIGGM
jgi:hypothetical protein